MNLQTFPLIYLQAHLDPRSCMKHTDADLQRMVGSILEYGQLLPVVFNATLELVVFGEEIVEAMIAAGETDASVSVVTMDDTQHGMASIALRAPYGKWDRAKLSATLKTWAVAGADPDLCFLPTPQIERLLGQTTPIPRTPKTCPRCGALVDGTHTDGVRHDGTN
jgi:hypothetical protein